MKHLAFSLVFLPGIAAADIKIEFIEGAPKDRFVIENRLCDVADARIVIDLETAPAGLIFDVTADGAGVEVFQPVEVSGPANQMASVTDGDQRLEIQLAQFQVNDTITITADIDDTMTNSSLGQIRVSDNEIAGVSTSLVSANGVVTGVIDETSIAYMTGAMVCLNS